MRVWRPAALSVCLLAAGLVSAASAQQTSESTLNWAFGGTVHAVARAGNVAFVGGEFNAVDAGVVFIGGHFRNVDGVRRPRLAGVLASASGSGPYLLPWRPRWFGNVLDLASAPDGLLAVGDALPDLDDQEIDPVGRAAFFPSGGNGTVPAAPTDLSAELDDHGALTVLWQAPVRGPRPLRYLLFAGSSPGASNLANGVDVGVLSLVRVGRVPAGIDYIRVRAIGIRGASRDSEEVMVTAGQPGGGGAPEAPGGLQVSVVGGVAAFSWSPSASPGVRYRLLAGSRPGEAAFVRELGAATSASVAAPQGLYNARVVALSACGQSTSSEESLVAVGAAALLLVAPSRVVAVVTAGAVQVSWTPPAGAGAFVIEAGSAPGLADLGVIAHAGSVARFTHVPAGTYYLRVKTRTAAGLGAGSDEVVLVVP